MPCSLACCSARRPLRWPLSSPLNARTYASWRSSHAGWERDTHGLLSRRPFSSSRLVYVFFSADAATLVVAGMMATVTFDGALPALAREQAWLASCSAFLLIAAVALRIAKRRAAIRAPAACGWLVLGVAAGATIPATGASPTWVSTHAVPVRVRADCTDLIAALEKVDDDPQAIVGHRITMHGTWSPAGIAPASVSVRIMACCAADAIDAGFDVAPRGVVTIPTGTSVLVSGVLHGTLRDGELRYRLDDATVDVAAPRAARVTC